MSFVYELHCKMCNKILKYKADMDEGFDIIVDVEPCKYCMEEAVQNELKEQKRDRAEIFDRSRVSS